jgi:hypothetical protein
MQTLEEKTNEAELAAIRGSPDLLKQYQEKQALTRQIRQLEQEKRQVAALVAEATAMKGAATEAKKDVLLSMVADKVTPDKLEKLKLLDLTALQVLVETIGTSKGDGESKGHEFTPDSAIGSGGMKRLGDLPPQERVKESERRLATGAK